MNVPVRFPNPFELDPDNLGCDQCGQYPVVEAFDGDRMCARCADKYPAPAPDADEIADLRRSMRKAGVNRGALIEARLVEMGDEM